MFKSFAGIKKYVYICNVICIWNIWPKVSGHLILKPGALICGALVSGFPPDVEPACRDSLPRSHRSISEVGLRRWVIRLSVNVPVHPEAVGWG